MPSYSYDPASFEITLDGVPFSGKGLGTFDVSIEGTFDDTTEGWPGWEEMERRRKEQEAQFRASIPTRYEREVLDDA